MRVAAIYDIHGNLPALEAVLRNLQRDGVDQVVVGGDVIPGPMPEEVITALLNVEIPVHFIRGNGEREVLAQLEGRKTDEVPERFREAMGWVGEQLTRAQRARLAGWPHSLRLEIPGLGQVLFCHATPRSDTYDLRAAADRIRATEYPQAAKFAERNVLQAPSETEMLEVFERAALKAEQSRS